MTPVARAWTLILVACCLNVLTLEMISRVDAGAGDMITFAQFLFITLEGAAQLIEKPIRDAAAAQQETRGTFWLRWSSLLQYRLRARVIPLRTYLKFAAFFMTASLLNNKALAYRISLPVHTVFRSSGLAGTLVTGALIYGKRYSMRQILSCAIVCAGIVALTLADAVGVRTRPAAACCSDTIPLASNATSHLSDIVNTSTSPNAPDFDGLLAPLRLIVADAPMLASAVHLLQWLNSVADLQWLVGMGMLIATLLLLALLGHEQEATYRTYGKHVVPEVVLWQHLVSLPFFLAVSKQIVKHASAWWNEPQTYAIAVSAPAWLSTSLSATPFDALFSGGVRISLWWVLLANLVTQSFCFKGVASLTAHTSTLTTAMALTVRKCVSLILSIVAFNNVFTPMHWLGSVLVFGGIALYTQPTKSDAKAAGSEAPVLRGEPSHLQAAGTVPRQLSVAFNDEPEPNTGALRHRKPAGQSDAVSAAAISPRRSPRRS